MKTTRDPRVDPRPGDVFYNKAKAVSYFVDVVGARNVWCEMKTEQGTFSLLLPRVRFESWAEDMEVIHAANHPTPGSWHVHRDNPDRCITVIQVTPEQVMVRNELGKVEVIPTKEWETQWIEQ